jgi:NitT/TauT family transport system ATP-binding protein
MADLKPLAMEPPAFIKTDRLVLGYEDRAVVELSSISVPREVRLLAICGPSGCGKTTLLRALAGLQRPISGRVFILGNPVVDANPSRSYLPQSLCLFPWKSVLQNVEFGLLCQGVKASLRRDRAWSMLDAVGLAHCARSAVQVLSGGMRQRVALARALATEPDCVFLDEPFSALDEESTEQLCVLISKMAARTTRFVVVSHDLRATSYLADLAWVHDGANSFRTVSMLPVNHPRGRDLFDSTAHNAATLALRTAIRFEGGIHVVGQARLMGSR